MPAWRARSTFLRHNRAINRRKPTKASKKRLGRKQRATSAATAEPPNKEQKYAVIVFSTTGIENGEQSPSHKEN